MCKVGIFFPIIFSSLGSIVYGLALFGMDILVAYKYGTGSQAAILQSAMIVSTLLIGMWSGGAVIGAFVPIFVRLGGKDKKKIALIFLRSSISIIIIIMVPLLIIVGLSIPFIVTYLTLGFTPEERTGVGYTVLLLLPMVLIHCLAYVFYSAMISINKPGFANLIPFAIPATGIATFPVWGNANGAIVISLGYNVGALLMLLSLAYKLHRQGFKVSPAKPFVNPEHWDFTKIYFVSSLAYAALSGVLIVSQANAATMSSTEFAHFSYAIKLIILVNAFYTSILNSVFFPKISAELVALKSDDQWQLVWRSLACSFLCGCFVAILFYFLSEIIIQALYLRGQFNYKDVFPVAALQKTFALHLPFYFLGVFSWRLLNNFASSIPLVVVSTLALILNFILSRYLMAYFGLDGVAAAYTFSIMVWSSLLTYILRTKILPNNS